jgi:hypothetical protein
VNCDFASVESREPNLGIPYSPAACPRRCPMTRSCTNASSPTQCGSTDRFAQTSGCSTRRRARRCRPSGGSRMGSSSGKTEPWWHRWFKRGFSGSALADEAHHGLRGGVTRAKTNRCRRNSLLRRRKSAKTRHARVRFEGTDARELGRDGADACIRMRDRERFGTRDVLKMAQMESFSKSRGFREVGTAIALSAIDSSGPHAWVRGAYARWPEEFVSLPFLA